MFRPGASILEHVDVLRIGSPFHTREVSEHDILKDEGSVLNKDEQHIVQPFTSHDILSQRQGFWGGGEEGGLLAFQRHLQHCRSFRIVKVCN
jgi:hypothetical protein